MRIVEWPSPVLEERAKEVEVFDEELSILVKNMKETMHHHNGVGLAANQVGVLSRVMVINIPRRQDEDEDSEDTNYWWYDKDLVFINPKITKKSGKVRSLEGCLSFPEIYEWVDRAEEVTVSALDAAGEAFEIEAKGLLSMAVQHELDHLDGIVMIGRMSRLKANLLRKRMMKRQKNAEREENA